VERRAPDPFRDGDRCNDHEYESHYGHRCRPGFGPMFMDSPAYGIRTTCITLESCYEIFRQLGRDVGYSIRQRNAEWLMGRRQFDDLIRDRRSNSAIRFFGTPQLFGIPVLLSGVDIHEIELRCF
jgi:hypothetical protein